jgi:hypothetical protein
VGSVTSAGVTREDNPEVEQGWRPPPEVG